MILVIMGVCGCGKSEIGKQLSDKLQWPMVEADDFHSEENKLKMAQGKPLTDDDRRPWLLSLHAVIVRWLSRGENGVVTCSALKRVYRDTLLWGDPQSNPTQATGENDASNSCSNRDGTKTHHNPEEQPNSAKTNSPHNAISNPNASAPNSPPSPPVKSPPGPPVTFVHLHGPAAVISQRLGGRSGHFMPAAMLDSQLATLEMLGSDENGIIESVVDRTPGEILAHICQRLSL